MISVDWHLGDFIFYDACGNVTTDFDMAFSAIRKSEEHKIDATIWKVFTGTRKSCG